MIPCHSNSDYLYFKNWKETVLKLLSFITYWKLLKCTEIEIRYTTVNLIIIENFFLLDAFLYELLALEKYVFVWQKTRRH